MNNSTDNKIQCPNEISPLLSAEGPSISTKDRIPSVSACLFSENGIELLSILAKKKVHVSRIYLSELDPTITIEKVKKIYRSQSVEIKVLKIGQTIDDIGREEADVGILLLLWWPYILKKNELYCYKYVINVHPSLLPYGRGKYGYFWSILNNEPFGASLHLVDEGVDSGLVLVQIRVEVLATDTGGDLYDKGVRACMKLFEDNIYLLSFEKTLENLINNRNKNHSRGSYHDKADFNRVCQEVEQGGLSLERAIRYLRSRTFHNGRSFRYMEDGKTYECRLCINEVDP